MAKRVSRLKAIAEATPAAGRSALLQTGVDIYEVSQQLVPVDEGLLKASGGVVPVDSSTVHVGYGGSGSEREDVAIFQELGTSKMAAQPYLTPAMHQGEATFKARLEEEIKKII